MNDDKHNRLKHQTMRGQTEYPRDRYIYGRVQATMDRGQGARSKEQGARTGKRPIHLPSSIFHLPYRRSLSGLLAFVFVSSVVLATILLMSVPVQASTADIVPNTDVTAGWATTGGSNDATCAGGTHCDFVDEGSTPVDTDFVRTGTAGNDGDTEEYGMTTVSNVETATQVSV